MLKLLGARLRAYRGSVMGMVALVALVTVAIGGLLSYVDLREVANLRSDEALSTGSGAALGIQTRLLPDAHTQDATVRALIGEHTGGAPVLVERSLRSEPLPIAHDAAEIGEQIVLLGQTPGTEADARVRLTEGTWPQRAGDGALQDAAAHALGVSVGDVLTVGSVPITVTALWLPDDPRAPGWSIDDLARTGTDGRGTGPLIVAETTLEQVQPDPFVRWTIILEPAFVTASDIQALASGLSDLPGALKASDGQSRGIVLTGDLAKTADSIAKRTSTARTISAVPTVLVGLISVVALIQVAHLVIMTRRRETQMVVARGASIQQLTLLGVAESLIVSLVGALVGTALTIAGLAGVGLAPFLPQALPTLGIVLAGVAVGAVVITTATVALDARAVSSSDAGDVAGRSRSVIGASAIVFLLAAAAFTGWRLWLARTDAEFELLGILAPAVVLLALTLTGLLILSPLLVAGERLAIRSRRLGRVLAVRQVSRRLAAYAVPALLVALATGACVVAASYAHTTQRVADTVAELEVGTDLRVATGSGAAITPRADVLVPVSIRAAEQQSGQSGTRAALVVSTDARIGQDTARFLALRATSIADVMRDGGSGATTVTSVALGAGSGIDDGGSAVEKEERGITLPAGTATLRIEVTGRAAKSDKEDSWAVGDVVDGPPLGVSVHGWFENEGALIKRDLAVLDLPVGRDLLKVRDETGSSEIDLPDEDGHWRLVAVDVNAGGPDGSVDFEVVLADLRPIDSSGTPLERPGGDPSQWKPWQPMSLGQDGAEVIASRAADALSIAATVDYGREAQLRLLPEAIFAQAQDDAPAPVVVTSALLDRLDLAVGALAEFHVDGSTIPARIAGSNDVLPGGLEDLAVIADMDWVRSKQFATAGGPRAASEIWVASDNRQVIDALAAELPRTSDRSAPLRTGNSSEPGPETAISAAFWFAAGGVVILALAGTWAVLSALVQGRRGEVIALRAVGWSAGQQRRARTSELLIVSGFGIVTGAVAGVAVAWAVAPILTRATIPTAPIGLNMPFGVQPLGLILSVLLLVLGLVVLSRAISRVVTGQAEDLEFRQEAT